VKYLIKDKFVKLWVMLGLQQATIMGGFKGNLISPLEWPEHCVNWGVLKQWVK